MPNEIKFEYNRDDAVKAARLIAIGAGVFILGLLAATCVYSVQPSENAIVMRFGKFHSTSTPGLHVRVPFLDQVLIANMRERTIRLPFGVTGESQEYNRLDQVRDQSSEDDILMLTGDLNAARVEWTIQWQVSDPRNYLTTFHSDQYAQFLGSADAAHDRYMESIITTVGRTVMNRLVGDYSFGEVLTSRRTEIEGQARESTQELLDEYETGIRITSLQLQRVTPPEKVKASYEAVNEAVQTRDKLENEAERERNEVLPTARADRDKLIQEATGYADRRRSEVRGEIDALMAQYREFSKAPEETRQRLYLEALESAMSKVKNKTIIDSDLQQQLLPLLNLNGDSN